MLLPVVLTLHVLGVVVWIGGVAFVTMIVFPMLLKMDGSLEKVLFFQSLEHRFAKIAKATVALVGLTGFWLLHLTGEWPLLFTPSGIGPTIMLIVWSLYVLILLFEGKLFQLLFGVKAQQDPTKIFRALTVFHWVVLTLSLLAVGVGVWAAHGGLSMLGG